MEGRVDGAEDVARLVLGARREHLERLVEPAAAVEDDVEGDHDDQRDREGGGSDVLSDRARVRRHDGGRFVGEVAEPRLVKDVHRDAEAVFDEPFDAADELGHLCDELRDPSRQLLHLLDHGRDDRDDHDRNERDQRHVDEHDRDGAWHVQDARQAVDGVDQQRADEVGEEEDEEQVAQEAPQAGQSAEKVDRGAEDDDHEGRPEPEAALEQGYCLSRILPHVEGPPARGRRAALGEILPVPSPKRHRLSELLAGGP